MSNSDLSTLWNIITNSTLPHPLDQVSKLFSTCDSLLKDGLFELSYLNASQSKSINFDSVKSTLEKQQKTPENQLEDRTELTLSIIGILHTSLKSTSSLIDDYKNLPQLPVVVEDYFEKRRLILSIWRFIFEVTRPFENAAVHPYQTFFLDNYVDYMKESKEFTSGLLEEYGWTLVKLEHHAENPGNLLKNADFLTLQLQDSRDLLLLLFHLVSCIPKDKPSLDALLKPLLTHSQSLQKFPVATSEAAKSGQLALLGQISGIITALIFRYFSISSHVFLRNDTIRSYLDDTLPKGHTTSLLNPATVLWLTLRAEAEPDNVKLQAKLIQSLTEFSPFALLADILKSHYLNKDSLDIFAGLVYDFGEQFIRLVGTDFLGNLSESLYSLAVVLFKFPREASRFWLRWTENGGADLQFGWGQLTGLSRDSVPQSFPHIIAIFAALFTSLTQSAKLNASAVRQINEVLWNLDNFCEEMNENEVEQLEIVRRDEEGKVSVVRSDLDRLPYKTEAVVIPEGTFGLVRHLPDGSDRVSIRWTLPDACRISIWTLCALNLEQLLTSAKGYPSPYPNAQSALDLICGIYDLYSASVQADSKVHHDLQAILELLCRASGCLLQTADQTKVAYDISQLLGVLSGICQTEASFRGVGFLGDLDLVAPFLPKALHPNASDVDWLRNGNIGWYSPFWQRLSLHAEKFGACLGHLAKCLSAFVENEPEIVRSTDPLVQQVNLFLLNIGLPFLAQSDDDAVEQGVESVLKYCQLVLKVELGLVEQQVSIQSAARACLYEGPAGQALVTLLRRSNKLIDQHVQLVQLIVQTVKLLLEQLDDSSMMSSFEHALLTKEKTRQMQTISLSPSSVNAKSKPPMRHLLDLITSGRDAVVVENAVHSVKLLITLQQPSLMAIIGEDVEQFVHSVFRLLDSPVGDFVWEFLKLCDSKQPRLLDLFLNLKVDAEKEGGFVVDVDDFPSLLDCFLGGGKQVSSCGWEFVWELLKSRNDYTEYLTSKVEFWKTVFANLETVPDAELDWSEKMSAGLACDIVCTQLALKSSKGVLLEDEAVDDIWRRYFEETLPRIFPHLNKHVPRLLQSMEDDPAPLAALIRFFSSWCKMHLLAAKQKSLAEVFTPQIKQDFVRTLFVLLKRCLIRAYKSDFVTSVTSSLSQSLVALADDLDDGQFYQSVVRIVEELVELTCGLDTYPDWNDHARHQILLVAKLVTMKLDGNQEVRRIIVACVNAVNRAGNEWRVGGDEVGGWVLGGACDVLVDLVADDSESEELFKEYFVYEVLVGKSVEIISEQSCALTALPVLRLLLVRSQCKGAVERIEQANYSTRLALPLAGLVDKFSVLFDQQQQQEQETIEDVVQAKNDLTTAQQWMDVYLTALEVEHNQLENAGGGVKSAAGVRFVAAQLGGLRELLIKLEDGPSEAVFRMTEMLARLMSDICQEKLSYSTREYLLKSTPKILHLMCGQIVRRADELSGDVDLLDRTPVDHVLKTMSSSLKVLHGEVASIEDILNNKPKTIPFMVEFDFASPASKSSALSFGSLIYVIRSGVAVLSQEKSAVLYGLVFKQPVDEQIPPGQSRLLDAVEQCAYFLLKQAVAFAAGHSQLSGDRWSETLQELDAEMVDLRHSIHDFTRLAQETAPPRSPAKESRVKSFLELMVNDMMSFKKFYGDAADEQQQQELSKNVERKRVTFNLR